LGLYHLTKQALLEKEKRNDEVIMKIRNSLENIFKADIKSEPFEAKLEPFWGVLE